MRIKTFIVVIYACLSISAYHWKPVSTIESLALIFYKPWESLWGLLPEERLTSSWNLDQSLVQRAETMSDASEEVSYRWWGGVIPPSDLLSGYLPLAGRVMGRILSSQNRFTYYLEYADSVAPGDPVVVGESLVGFVTKIDAASGRVTVVLLNHEASPPVLGEVRGTVAGKGVYFIAGGPSPGLTGCIDVQFPSSRFGLNSGSLAYSKAHSENQEFPSRFLLGQVRVGRPKMGELQEEVALDPVLEPWELNRVCVLVPADRPGFEESRLLIPSIPMERIPVQAKVLPVGREPHPAFRVSSGMEEGLAPGTILIRHGTAVARLSRVGLFSSFADFLAAPGDEITVAYLPENGMTRPLRIKVIQRQGFRFLCEFTGRRARVCKGDPLFIAEKPCSGLESYPAFWVEESVDENRFIVHVPWSWDQGDSHCLRFTGATVRR